MRGFSKRLMAVVTAFAFILGMSVPAAPSAGALGLTAPTKASEAGQHCPRMAAAASDQPAPASMPGKGIMPDGAKQMGCCIGSPSLPSRSAELRMPVAYRTVVYWSPVERRAGRSIAPDLLPPRAS